MESNNKSNDEMVALMKDMGVDPSKDTDEVKMVKASSKRKKKTTRKPRAKKTSEKEQQAETQPAEAPADEEPATTPPDNKNEDYHAVFRARPTFEDDIKHPTSFDFFLDGIKVVVTEEDKDLYLKAVLNDTPLTLDVTVARDIVVTCRAVTPYERDIAAHAVAAYCKSFSTGTISEAFLTDYVRQYLMSMQVLAINGSSVPHLSYTAADGTREEHISDLAKRGKLITDNYSLPRYNLLLKALNVFEHKLSHLNSAALNQDFWAPGGAD